MSEQSKKQAYEKYRAADDPDWDDIPPHIRLFVEAELDARIAAAEAEKLKQEDSTKGKDE